MSKYGWFQRDSKEKNTEGKLRALKAIDPVEQKKLKIQRELEENKQLNKYKRKFVDGPVFQQFKQEKIPFFVRNFQIFMGFTWFCFGYYMLYIPIKGVCWDETPKPTRLLLARTPQQNLGRAIEQKYRFDNKFTRMALISKFLGVIFK